jgi:hypothetical protein
MKTSNEALLRFGFLWIQFAIFGEPTMKVREEAKQAVQDKLDKKGPPKGSAPPTSPQKEVP